MIQTDLRKLANRSDARRGFTLVELLVVLGIVALITAISAGAAIQVIAYARASNTQTKMQTLLDILSRQWSAVVRQARNETIPPSIVSMAGGDQYRAKVIWIKLRLKQEFPMNFSEALYPWALPPSALTATDPYIGQTTTSSPYGPTVLPARPSYAQALFGAGIYVPQSYLPTLPTPPSGSYAASNDPRGWPAESAVMLLLALQQNRDGTGITSDELSKLGTADYVDPTTGKDTGLKMLVDGWGQPLAFYRWPTPASAPYDPLDPSNANNRDVDSACPGGASLLFRDPDDAEGMLVNPTWNNSTNWSSATPGAVFWFDMHCHSVHEFVAGVYQARAYYTVPIIVSAGRNKVLGFAQPPSPIFSTATNPFYSPLLPDPMCIDAGADPNGIGYHDGSFDNLLSYRLRQGGRGE
jgi:prepilin-type N-terminal cleavage/methylation domain-containing protein